MSPSATTTKSIPFYILGSTSRWRRNLFSKHFNQSWLSKSKSDDATVTEEDDIGSIFLAPDIDEKNPSIRTRGDCAERLVQDIARAKAKALVESGKFKLAAEKVKKRYGGLTETGATLFPVLVCLDQVVRFKGEIREKPEDKEKAKEYLESYKNSSENDFIECVNGICITAGSDDRFLTTFEISSIRFPNLTDAMINNLLSEGSCLTCAEDLCVRE